MLAKRSLVASMFVLEDDANLSRRAAAAVPGAHHICSLLVATAPKPLTAAFLVSSSTDQFLPAFTISGTRQHPHPAAWDQAATTSSGEEGKILDVTPERGSTMRPPLRWFSPVPGQFPSCSLPFLPTLLVALLYLGSGHAWAQQVENFA